MAENRIASVAGNTSKLPNTATSTSMALRSKLAAEYFAAAQRTTTFPARPATPYTSKANEMVRGELAYTSRMTGVIMP